MAQKHEGGKKFATIRPTGYALDSKGRVASITTEIAGHPDAVKATTDLIQSQVGAENFVKIEDDATTSKSWGGVGDGKMKPGRGLRTKRVFVKGKGWVDVSLN